MSRAGSATRHIQFNVIDATKMPPPIYPEGYSSLNRPGSHRSATVSSEDERVVNATGRQPMPNGTQTHQRSVPGPVYYPPGTSIAQQAGYQQVQPMTTVSNGKHSYLKPPGTFWIRDPSIQYHNGPGPGAVM